MSLTALGDVIEAVVQPDAAWPSCRLPSPAGGGVSPPPSGEHIDPCSESGSSDSSASC